MQRIIQPFSEGKLQVNKDDAPGESDALVTVNAWIHAILISQNKPSGWDRKIWHPLAVYVANLRDASWPSTKTRAR